ncbi:MAG: hypothetical protein V9E98_08360 [Candidatus Nanopelagicales bacterium]
MTVTVAVELWLVASVIVYWKVSVPVKLALGVYWIVPLALTVAVPLAGAAAIVVTIGGEVQDVRIQQRLEWVSQRATEQLHRAPVRQVAQHG